MAKETAQPTMPVATFGYDFGVVSREKQSTFAEFRAYNFQNYEIAIRGHSIYGFFDIWFGVVAEMDLRLDGAETFGVGSGFEAITAYGLEYLLARRKVDGTFISDLDAAGANIKIDREVVFNRRFTVGASDSGNRSASRNAAGIYTHSATDTDLWTNLDIIEYVIDFFQTDLPRFRLVGQPEILDQIVDRHDLFGMNVLDCLNKLIDRRRGVGWRLVTDGRKGGIVGIFVYSMLADPIWLEETSIPANPYQDTLYFDSLIDIKTNIKFSTKNLYDRIEVLGERMKICGTLSPENGTFQPFWTAAEETAYEAASDTERASDKFDTVFTKFRPPSDWNLVYATLISGDPNFVPDNSPPVFDTYSLRKTRDGKVFRDTHEDITGGEVELAPVWNHDQMFLRWIPLEEISAAVDAEKEYREPFAIIWRGEALGYQYVDRLKNELEKANQFHSLRLTISNHDFAIVVRGTANHLLGGAAPGTDPDNPGGGFPDAPIPETSIPAELDWFNLFVTLAWELDTRIGVDLRLPGPTESGKTLLIEVPGAEYWAIGAGTIDDVTDGVIGYNNGGVYEVVRDDSDRLRAIAITAAAWYGMQRSVISYEFTGLAPFHPVGMLIRGAVGSTVGLQPVGTVVTERKWDFEGKDGFGKTSVRTGAGELDAVMVAG